MIAVNHLSTLLQLAPKLETFCLGWWSSDRFGFFQEEMDVQELRGLRSRFEKGLLLS
jgi:hypothetical protein